MCERVASRRIQLSQNRIANFHFLYFSTAHVELSEMKCSALVVWRTRMPAPPIVGCESARQTRCGGDFSAPRVLPEIPARVSNASSGCADLGVSGTGSRLAQRASGDGRVVGAAGWPGRAWTLHTNTLPSCMLTLGSATSDVEVVRVAADGLAGEGPVERQADLMQPTFHEPRAA